LNKAEQATQIFSQGFNCAQSTVCVFCEELGVSKESALKISGGFGSGMRHGEVCGAVSGAIMVLGLKYGQNREGDKESKEKTNRLVEEFNQRFEDRNGSIICRDLLGCDISEENGRTHAMDNHLFDIVCPKLIRSSVEIVEEIL